MSSSVCCRKPGGCGVLVDASFHNTESHCDPTCHNADGRSIARSEAEHPGQHRSNKNSQVQASCKSDRSSAATKLHLNDNHQVQANSRGDCSWVAIGHQSSEQPDPGEQQR